MKTMHLPVERVTSGPKHHFFGYFDKYPWDRSGRRLLAHQTSFVARQPVPGEKAVIGDGKIGPVTQKLYDTMTGMQWGKLPDTKGWIVPVEKQF